MLEVKIDFRSVKSVIWVLISCVKLLSFLFILKC